MPRGPSIFDNADCLDLTTLRLGGICRAPDGRLWTLVRVWRPEGRGEDFVEFVARDGLQPDRKEGSFFGQIFHGFQIVSPGYAENVNYGPVPEIVRPTKRVGRMSLAPANSNYRGWLGRLLDLLLR